MSQKIVPTEDELRTHYKHTALARIGIQFERAMQIESVRKAVEGAALAAARCALGTCAAGG